ncbi:hypothetical protein E2986_12702 [Frieseomelitta varia]|uniref:Uncharacterized protein n=1 Tax=Frieseomelitta varia TaxID=561572 RepID=A0A833W1A6_9HYME|nr:hypothetical protein E2986_12702 [Frieseomelitta varia]
MATDEKWYFTKEQLTNTPSRRCGIDADKELSYRQQAANFIQDMGQRLVEGREQGHERTVLFVTLSLAVTPSK